MSTRLIRLSIVFLSLVVFPGRSGAVLLGGNITTSGGQTYTSAVTLTNNTVLTSTGSGAITFSSTVDGGYSLTVNTAGTTAFSGAIGSTTALADLTTDAAGTTLLNGGSVITSGSQTYGDVVQLGASTTVVSTGSGGITFGNIINGAFGLTVNTAGTTAFSGAIGSTTALTSLTTDAPGTTLLNGGSVTTSGSQTYGDAVQLGTSTTLTSFGGGSITFGNTVNGAYGLTVNTAGTTAFYGLVGSTAALANLTTDAAGATLLSGGSVTTSGSQTYNDSLQLGANTTVTSFGGGNITFANIVNGAYGLTVNTAGTTAFNGAVGSTAALANLTTDPAGTTLLNGGSVTTSGSQTYGDMVQLGASTTVASTGSGGITFGNTVNGAYGLTVNTAGTTAFSGAIGSTTALASLTTDAAGTTLLNAGSVTTGGSQTYGDAVQLGAGTTVTSFGGGNVTFGNTVNGAYGLTVNTAGTTAFNGAIGSTTALANLTTDAAGTTLLNGGSVITSGSQTYGDAVQLGASTTLTSFGGGNITFANIVNGAYGLTVNTAGTTAFNGAIGSTTALTSLTTDSPGTTLLNGGLVTTGGPQTYNDAVQLGANTTLMSFGGGNITFGNTVNGAFGLTVNTAGTTAFNGAIGLTTALANLTTDAPGTTLLSGGSVTTSGSQTYDDAVQLGASTTLTSFGGGNVTFGNTVNGAFGLNVNTAGTTAFNGAVGATIALASLTTDAPGTTLLSGGSVSTAGAQTYGDTVVLGADTALVGTALSLLAVSGNNHGLTLVNSAVSILTGSYGGIGGFVLNGSGLLAVNGTLSASTVTVNNGATLGGNGTLLAPVAVQSGGTLSPGTSIGVLTVSNSLSLGGTALLELNKAGATNDQVRGITLLSYGGALRVTNLNGTLAAGDSFKLFQAATYSGAFTNFFFPLLQNGLVWDSSRLATDGSIAVMPSPPSRITAIKAVAAHTIELTGTGVASQVYFVRASTNLALPLPQWWLLGATNSANSGLIGFTDALATNDHRFYRLAQ